jgi:hypothetical protein
MANKSFAYRAGIIAFILVCSSIILIREIAIRVERDRCDERLSEELHVTFTPGKIRSAIYSRLNTLLEPGMSNAEVMAILPEIAPPSVEWKETRSDGGFNEYVILETCSFHRNGYSFLFLYSRDQKFEEVINYIDD